MVARNTPNKSAIIAGVGLFAMAILAGVANFGALESGDTRLAAWLFSLVAILDVIVAIALYVYFAKVSRPLSSLAMSFRLGYAGLFATAIGYLFIGDVELFNQLWQIALILFGIHLGLLAVLLWRAKFTPTWLAILVAFAGIGYLFDSVVFLGVGKSGFELSTVTFIGEVVLLLWLLIKGWRVKN